MIANDYIRIVDDQITISQMTPRPIAVNSATFVGPKIAGVLGAVVATFGCILPSCIIVTVLAKLYLKYRSVGYDAGGIAFTSPCSSSNDSVSGNFDSYDGFLGKWYGYLC